MTQLEMFKNNWKPNYSDSSYECFCFRTDLNKLIEEIRADERAKVLDELVNAIDEDNYCLLDDCVFYQHCKFHSCPIDSQSKLIIQNWLKRIKEQK